MYELALLTNVLLWLGVSLYYVRLPSASAFHPASYYLFFHGFIFTLRPIVVYNQGYTTLYNGYQYFPSPSDKLTVLMATMVGFISFMIPVLKIGCEDKIFLSDKFVEMERNELVKPFLFVTMILTPFALFSAFANWTTRSTESTTMIFDSTYGRFIHTASSGYFDDFQLVLAPLAVMCIWLFRFKLWTFVPLALYIVLRGGTGGRWPIMMACATVALMFLHQNRQKWPDLKASILLIFSLWMFQVVGSDRGATIRSFFIDENSIAYTNRKGNELGFLESMDWANLEFFEYIVYSVPQRSGTYGYFLDNLQLFTEPVPRVFWPEKPVGPPIQLFSLFDYGYPIGMTYSLPGEGWMQLGYLGVVIWCGLFGWFYGLLYNKFQRSTQSTLATITFLLVLPLSLQFFRDGLLLTMVRTHAWFLMPVLMVYGFARLSAVPLADEIRMMAIRRSTRRRPDIAAKILARQRGAKRSVFDRND